MAICMLPGCNKKARRKFCSNKHKDRYHNITNPRGKFAHLKNTTSKRYYVKREEINMFNNKFDDGWDHPCSGEALGQS